MSAELDGTGDVDKHIDKPRACEQESVLGSHRFTSADRIVELALRLSHNNVVVAGIAKDVERSADVAIRYGDHAHPGRAVDDLIGQALAHETSTYDCHADRFSLGCARSKSIVDKNHVSTPEVWTLPRIANTNVYHFFSNACSRVVLRKSFI